MLSNAEQVFLRPLVGPRAAHLNQQVVVIGGLDDVYDARDEVLQWTPLTEEMILLLFAGASLQSVNKRLDRDWEA